jgi:amino acid transporter
MVAGYIIATVSGVEVLGPSVLAVFGSNSTSISANIANASAVDVVMLIVAIIGIRITAKVQIGSAVIEYFILIGFGIVGLAAVFSQWHGVMHPFAGWFNPVVSAAGSTVAGFLVAVFIFTAWDGAV